MVKLSTATTFLLLATSQCHAFVTPARHFAAPPSYAAKTSTVLSMDPSPVNYLSDMTSTLLSYSDDPVGDQLKGVNGLVIGGILATFVSIGVGFKALLPSVGKASFILTPEEESAIDRVTTAYDSQKWQQELTEEGTKGYVERRNKAQDAKDKYQDGRVGRDIKDRSLRYSETDLGFVACMIRAAEPAPGAKFVDLGSGCGRSTLGAAGVFPGFGKCVGVEFLEPLVKLSNGYKGKVRGKKAPVEFVSADFAEYDLSDADVVFASATYYNNGDLEKSLTTLGSGAKVLTIDKRLSGGDFRLITEVEDPNRDLVLNTGYVFEKL